MCLYLHTLICVTASTYEVWNTFFNCLECVQLPLGGTKHANNFKVRGNWSYRLAYSVLPSRSWFWKLFFTSLRKIRCNLCTASPVFGITLESNWNLYGWNLNCFEVGGKTLPCLQCKKGFALSKSKQYVFLIHKAQSYFRIHAFILKICYTEKKAFAAFVVTLYKFSWSL